MGQGQKVTRAGSLGSLATGETGKTRTLPTE